MKKITLISFVLYLLAESLPAQVQIALEKDLKLKGTTARMERKKAVKDDVQESKAEPAQYNSDDIIISNPNAPAKAGKQEPAAQAKKTAAKAVTTTATEDASVQTPADESNSDRLKRLRERQKRLKKN